MKGDELRRAVDERERAYYTEIIRQFPWPIAAIRAESPVARAKIEVAIRLSRRCHRVTYDWVKGDIGYSLTADEQGALLRHHREFESLACVVRHAHGGLTGLYFQPEIAPEVRKWLCPAELGLQPPMIWKPEPGDEVIWMVDR
jgi:hypothetical protein